MSKQEKRQTAGDKSNLWKDYFDRDCINSFASVLQSAYAPFDKKAYVSSVLTDSYDSLELKGRFHRLAERLRPRLPEDFQEAVKILIEVAPQLREFENWVLTAFIELFGLDHFDKSIHAMERLTKYGTAEFAIRPFMIHHTERMLPILMRWTQDKNEHLRRLAAEGSRPRGVWVAHIDQFKKDPTPVIRILNKLKCDSSLYVRKAVANNLNDISKEHPDLVLRVSKEWMTHRNPETDWIVRHACRSLLKQGHPDAFALFDFTAKPSIEIESFKVTPQRVEMGKKISISCKIRSSSRKLQKIAIDYKMHFMKANGLHSQKVFKWSEKMIKPGERVVIKKPYAFRDLSTRRHYPGKHKLELLINGLSKQEFEFLLLK